MKEKLLRKAERYMEAGVIMHIFINVLLALCMIISYSSFYNNLERIAMESSILIIVIAFLVIDTALAVLWLVRPLFHTIHLILFILLGWFIYPCVFVDFLLIRGIGALGLFLYDPFIIIIGLIPFIIYGKGKKYRKNALSLQDTEPRLETE